MEMPSLLTTKQNMSDQEMGLNSIILLKTIFKMVNL